jgi:hypothetical protein
MTRRFTFEQGEEIVGIVQTNGRLVCAPCIVLRELPAAHTDRIIRRDCCPHSEEPCECCGVVLDTVTQPLRGVDMIEHEQADRAVTLAAQERNRADKRSALERFNDLQKQGFMRGKS